MSDPSQSHVDLTNAAERLTRTCQSHLAASGRLDPPSVAPITANLRRAFGDGALTPIDMLYKLGQIK